MRVRGVTLTVALLIAAPFLAPEPIASFVGGLAGGMVYWFLSQHWKER